MISSSWCLASLPFSPVQTLATIEAASISARLHSLANTGSQQSLTCHWYIYHLNQVSIFVWNDFPDPCFNFKGIKNFCQYFKNIFKNKKEWHKKNLPPPHPYTVPGHQHIWCAGGTEVWVRLSHDHKWKCFDWVLWSPIAQPYLIHLGEQFCLSKSEVTPGLPEEETYDLHNDCNVINTVTSWVGFCTLYILISNFSSSSETVSCHFAAMPCWTVCFIQVIFFFKIRKEGFAVKELARWFSPSLDLGKT